MRVNAVVGFQSFTSTVITSAVTCSTAIYKNVTTGVLANGAWFSVGGSSGAIRYRDDGTAPLSNVGIRLISGIVPYLYQGDLSKLQFIVDAVPGNADVQISYVQICD